MAVPRPIPWVTNCAPLCVRRTAMRPGRPGCGCHISSPVRLSERRAMFGIRSSRYGDRRLANGRAGKLRKVRARGGTERQVAGHGRPPAASPMYSLLPHLRRLERDSRVPHSSKRSQAKPARGARTIALMLLTQRVCWCQRNTLNLVRRHLQKSRAAGSSAPRPAFCPSENHEFRGRSVVDRTSGAQNSLSTAYVGETEKHICTARARSWLRLLM